MQLSPKEFEYQFRCLYRPLNMYALRAILKIWMTQKTSSNKPSLMYGRSLSEAHLFKT